jgi:SLA1 homology domain 1, SHD1
MSDASPDRAPTVNIDEPAFRASPKSNEGRPIASDSESLSSPANRTLAAPAAAQPAPRVATPAFPTVSDDPFAPLVSPSPIPVTPENHSDDPFAPLPASPTTNDKPADPLVVEPTLKTIDLLAPGADGRLPLRPWTDNTGKFSVRAQLVLVLDGKVRLLKETGRTTTVGIERLSVDDRAYVAAATDRYGEDLAKLHQLAAR